MPLHYAITDNEAAHMFIVCLVALTTCFLKRYCSRLDFKIVSSLSCVGYISQLLLVLSHRVLALLISRLVNAGKPFPYFIDKFLSITILSASLNCLNLCFNRIQNFTLLS